jgi:hypothetical protein
MAILFARLFQLGAEADKEDTIDLFAEIHLNHKAAYCILLDEPEIKETAESWSSVLNRHKFNTLNLRDSLNLMYIFRGMTAILYEMNIYPESAPLPFDRITTPFGSSSSIRRAIARVN